MSSLLEGFDPRTPFSTSGGISCRPFDRPAGPKFIKDHVEGLRFAGAPRSNMGRASRNGRPFPFSHVSTDEVFGR